MATLRYIFLVVHSCSHVFLYSISCMIQEYKGIMCVCCNFLTASVNSSNGALDISFRLPVGFFFFFFTIGWICFNIQRTIDLHRLEMLLLLSWMRIRVAPKTIVSKFFLAGQLLKGDDLVSLANSAFLFATLEIATSATRIRINLAELISELACSSSNSQY